jgi:nucleotide-binding universal stress UspA family protein
MMAMAGTNTGDTAHVTELDPPPLAVRPLAVAHVVVPLDGSPFAERALPVGAWIAAAVGGDVHVVEVVPCDADEEAEAAIRYLDSVARSHGAAAWDVIERDDVGAALVDATDGSPGRLACLATHGAGRSLLLGSVAVSLLERSRQPVVMVGPVARAVTAVDAPIVVAVDGMVGDDVLVRVALAWAPDIAQASAGWCRAPTQSTSCTTRPCRLSSSPCRRRRDRRRLPARRPPDHRPAQEQKRGRCLVTMVARTRSTRA